MTTTITLKTHDWPVEVTIRDQYRQDRNGEDEGVTLTDITHVATVPPQQERQFYVTDTRTVVFKELPKPETIEDSQEIGQQDVGRMTRPEREGDREAAMHRSDLILGELRCTCTAPAELAHAPGACSRCGLPMR